LFELVIFVYIKIKKINCLTYLTKIKLDRIRVFPQKKKKLPGTSD
jgi:hypothetical protein